MQFLHFGEGQTPRISRPDSPVEPREVKDDGEPRKLPPWRRHRSFSVGESDLAAEMNERMKLTRDFKSKGYKANSRGNFIQAPFTTLEEMFKKLPESIGFNIEMSMFTS